MNTHTLEEKLNAAIVEHNFAGVIHLAQRGETIYARAAGYADRANKRPNTLETRFGIASGTKFLTALAIGRLIDAGRLALTTRLCDCAALNFTHYADAITIQQLLTHTSGIPDYLDEELIADFDNVTLDVPWYQLRGPRDYLALFPDAPMKFAPGKRFAYSNGGYILLGVVIEEVTGMRYQDFVAQEILLPLGMMRSGFFAMNKLPEESAYGYIEEADGGWRTNIYNLPIVGASDGGLYTTAAELALLWDGFWAGKILSAALVATFSQPFVSTGAENPNSYYGHGLWIADAENNAGKTQRQHFLVGSDAGVSFRSGCIQARQLQYSILSNTSNGAWPISALLRNELK